MKLSVESCHLRSLLTVTGEKKTLMDLIFER